MFKRFIKLVAEQPCRVLATHNPIRSIVLHNPTQTSCATSPDLQVFPSKMTTSPAHLAHLAPKITTSQWTNQSDCKLQCKRVKKAPTRALSSVLASCSPGTMCALPSVFCLWCSALVLYFVYKTTLCVCKQHVVCPRYLEEVTYENSSYSSTVSC